MVLKQSSTITNTIQNKLSLNQHPKSSAGTCPYIFKKKKKQGEIFLDYSWALFTKALHNTWCQEICYCHIPEQHNQVCITWEAHQSWSPFSSDKLDLLPIQAENWLKTNVVGLGNIFYEKAHLYNGNIFVTFKAASIVWYPRNPHPVCLVPFLVEGPCVYQHLPVTTLGWDIKLFGRKITVTKAFYVLLS